MKVVKIKNEPPRKLVAVLGTSTQVGRGIFFKSHTGGVLYLDNHKLTIGKTPAETLEELTEDSSRVPVYEGDTITITF